MPVRPNGFFNSPAFAQAAANLGSLFEPPSGADAAGWAAANATREKAARLAAQFAYASDPTFNQQVFDRRNIADGAYTPLQSYYAQDQNDATARRAQDVTAQTSLATNAADNQRALQTNAADNERAMSAAVLGAATAPVAEGAIRPAFDPKQYGVNVPAVPQFAGRVAPLTEPQQKAIERQKLISTGQLTDDMLLEGILGGQTPVQAVGPDGKTPQFMSPGAAVRTNAQPYIARADTQKLIEGTALVDGKTTQVFREPDSPIYRTAAGVPIPADIQVFDMAKPTGTSEQIGMKPTEFTTKNGMFAVRAGSADAVMNDLTQKQGYVPSMQDFELMLGGAGDVLPLSISNNLVSPQGRQFYNSSMGFMMSLLRPDTGAAFGKDEFKNYARIFIPLPGDDPQTLANKAAARSTALAALNGSSAGSADQIVKLMLDQGVPVPDEMLRNFERAQAAGGGAAAPTTAGAPLTAVPRDSAAPPAPGAAPARMKFDANGNPVQ